MKSATARTGSSAWPAGSLRRRLFWKALGTGVRAGVAFPDVIIHRVAGAPPQVWLTGWCRTGRHCTCIVERWLSISHAGATATAERHRDRRRASRRWIRIAARSASAGPVLIDAALVEIDRDPPPRAARTARHTLKLCKSNT